MSNNAMDWTGLPYFLAVARGGSLRAAAETLGGNHATVDRHVRALETAYGVRLFDRTRTGLRLTPEGEALLPEAEAAERAVLGTRLKLQGRDRKPSGTVRLSVPNPFDRMFMGPILGRFARAYPDIELDVSATNQLVDFSRAETDVSVRVAYEVSGDAVGRKVATYNRGIFAAQSYLDLHWYKRGAKGEGLHWLGWNDDEDRPAWVENSPFPMAKLHHRVRSASLVGPMLVEGQGMSYLPVFVPTHYPDLVQVPGTVIEPDRSIWVLLHGELRRTTRVRLLVDFLVEELKALRPYFQGEA